MGHIYQIMAECDCQHYACQSRGYCMAERIEHLEAQLAATSKVISSAHIALTLGLPDDVANNVSAYLIAYRQGRE